MPLPSDDDGFGPHRDASHRRTSTDEFSDYVRSETRSETSVIEGLVGKVAEEVDWTCHDGEDLQRNFRRLRDSAEGCAAAVGDGPPMPIRVPPPLRTLTGLEGSIAEALAQGIKGQLLASAYHKRDEVMKEMVRCAQERKVRLEAFKQCPTLMGVVSLLEAVANGAGMEASGEEGSGGGLAATILGGAASKRGATAGTRTEISKSGFLDLHLSLSRARYLTPAHATRRKFPYLYLRPPFVGKVAGEDEEEAMLAYGGEEEDGLLASWEAISMDDEEVPEAPLLRPWEEGCALWQAHATSAADGDRLPPGFVAEAVFEIIDSQLAHTKAASAGHLQPAAGAPTRAAVCPSIVNLRDYAEGIRHVVCDLVEAVPAPSPSPPPGGLSGLSPTPPSRPPTREPSPSTFRRASLLVTSESSDTPGAAHQLLRRPPSSSPLPRRASLIPNQPSTSASLEGSRPPSPGRSPLPWAMKSSKEASGEQPGPQKDKDGEEELSRSPSPPLERGPPPRAPLMQIRLRHCWPKMKDHYAEARRKLSLLCSAIREHSSTVALTHEVASREFRMYCRHAGASTSASQLSLTQLLIALHDMGGANYNALCFRHAVMGRPTGQLSYGPGKALAEAEHLSNEQMLCFLRLLADGDTAYVTHQQFCKVLTSSSSSSTNS